MKIVQINDIIGFLTRPPYNNFGACNTRPLISVIAGLIEIPNSCANGSLLNSAFRTKLAISRSRSGALRAVA
jgi:hypothetical protein